MLLELNNKNKKLLKNNNQTPKSRLINLYSKDICVIQFFIIKLKLTFTSKSKVLNYY
jgi:hypothetical protein